MTLHKYIQLTLITIFIVFISTGCSDKSSSTAIQEEIVIEKIKNYAMSNGTGDTPTIQDYMDVGVTGIDDTNIAELNEIVGNLTPEEVDTPEKIQRLIDELGINTVPETPPNPNSTPAKTPTDTPTTNTPPTNTPPTTITSTPDTTAPIFTSPNSVSVPENQTGAITLVATDSSTVTYSINGTDASSFNVNSSSGVVTFKTAPDYESGNILYLFTATATDTSGNSANQDVTIHVTDVNEGGVDADGDGYTTPSDCNDNNASIHPGALEIFGDSIDNNCNGQIDENGFLTELDGNWIDSFLNHYTFDIPLQTWSIIFSNNSTETIMISAVNSAQRYFIIKHGATANQPLANKYSKVYATPIINSNTGSYFYICEVNYGYATITSADDPNSVADSSNPETGGCGGFAWTKATKVP